MRPCCTGSVNVNFINKFLLENLYNKRKGNLENRDDLENKDTPFSAHLQIPFYHERENALHFPLKRGASASKNESNSFGNHSRQNSEKHVFHGTANELFFKRILFG